MIKDLKISKEISKVLNDNYKLVKKTAAPVGIAFMLSLTGCSNTEVIGDDYSIEEVVNAVSNDSLIDEYLESTTEPVWKYPISSNSDKISWDEALEKYKEAKENKNTSLWNKMLFMLQAMAYKAKIYGAMEGLANKKIDNFDLKVEKSEGHRQYKIICVITVVSDSKEKDSKPYVYNMELKLEDLAETVAEEMMYTGSERYLSTRGLKVAEEHLKEFLAGESELTTDVLPNHKVIGQFAVKELTKKEMDTVKRRNYR